MIDSFKLVYRQFEPVRESLSSLYYYEWTSALQRYQMKREGRTNERDEGVFPLAIDAEQSLLDFLLKHDLLTNRNINHNPYQDPAAFQGAEGLNIEIECQIGGKSIRQHYRGTSLQLEPYTGALHELWRLVHGFLPQALSS